MIRAINNRNNSQFGNGLPVYTRIDHQMRYNTTKPYKDGLLVAPFAHSPTFQFKAPEMFDGSEVFRFDANDNAFGTYTVGSDDNSLIVRRPTDDGEYIYTASEGSAAAMSSSGVFYFAFRLTSDPPGEYRYYTEQWYASNCMGDPPAP